MLHAELLVVKVEQHCKVEEVEDQLVMDIQVPVAVAVVATGAAAVAHLDKVQVLGTLAVAEALGGVQRPWQVANPSGRICMDVAPPGLVAA